MKRNTLTQKHFVINTGALKRDVLVCVNCRSKEINKILKTFDSSGPLTQDHADLIDKKPIGTAMYLFNNKTNKRIIALFPANNHELITLFDHEKMHALHHIMDHVGIRLSDKTEEIYAYTSEYMMSQFLKKA